MSPGIFTETKKHSPNTGARANNVFLHRVRMVQEQLKERNDAIDQQAAKRDVHAAASQRATFDQVPAMIKSGCGLLTV